jgi:hypothetical protein
MPYYQNSLYGRGVPSYAEQLSPLADVFKAFAPNPMRDLQIQGYASKANLDNLKGSEINTRLAAQKGAADAFRNNDQTGVYASILEGGDAPQMNALPGFVRGGYAARGINDPNAVNPGVLADLVVGAGGDYGDTEPGFGADQARQLQQNENTVAANRYGSELQAGASRYGSELSAGASRYGADQRLKGSVEAANIKSGNRGGAAAQFKVDPVKLDSALLQSIPGSFKDDKGRWNMDPSVSPADLSEVRARTAAYVQANPQDQYGAIQRAVADVYGDAPTITPEVPAQSTWYGSESAAAVPPQVVSRPSAQRPPRPNLGQQFAAPPVSAPAVPSMPNAQPGAAPNADLAAAKNAIAAGKSRQAVIDRLLKGGYNAQQIQAAGI